MFITPTYMLCRRGWGDWLTITEKRWRTSMQASYRLQSPAEIQNKKKISLWCLLLVFWHLKLAYTLKASQNSFPNELLLVKQFFTSCWDWSVRAKVKKKNSKEVCCPEREEEPSAKLLWGSSKYSGDAEKMESGNWLPVLEI